MSASDYRKFKCQWCDLSYGTRAGLKYHYTKSTSTKCIAKYNELENIGENLIDDEKEILTETNDEKSLIQIQPNNVFQIFDYESINIRTLHEAGECWFCAKDICGVLEIVNNRDAVSALDEDEYRLVRIPDTAEREREMGFINESGLYSLVFRSRKPNAKAFRKWITSEIIPQIRKTGSYHSSNLEQTKSTDIIPMETSFSDDQHKKIQGMISLHRHQPIPCSPGTSLLYLGYLGLDENLHHFKFGITENWGERIKDLLRDFNGEFSPIFLRSGIGRPIEQELKRFLSSKKLLTKYKAKSFTEVFYINEDTDIDTVLNEIERLSSLHRAMSRAENLEEQLRDERHKNELREEQHKNEVLQNKNEVLQLKSKVSEMEYKFRILELEHKIELSSYTKSK
jgi:prophage antirepressor-like protein